MPNSHPKFSKVDRYSSKEVTDFLNEVDGKVKIIAICKTERYTNAERFIDYEIFFERLPHYLKTLNK